jgi:hypothetical protein
MNSPENPAPDESDPGLPWFRSWRGVYLAVLGCFVAYVILLAGLDWFFA